MTASLPRGWLPARHGAERAQKAGKQQGGGSLGIPAQHPVASIVSDPQGGFRLLPEAMSSLLPVLHSAEDAHRGGTQELRILQPRRAS